MLREVGYSVFKEPIRVNHTIVINMIDFPILAKNTPIFLAEYIIAHTY